MEKCTIYYDDTKLTCREYADILSDYDQIFCKPASEYINSPLIYEENSLVGFLFESNKENVPYAIRHIIWRIIMDKKGTYFLAVTGGNRELKAIRCAVEELEVRGYDVSNIYSKYMFEKYHMDIETSAAKIVADLENGEAQYRIYKQMAAKLEKKELRRMLRKELKEYKKYKVNH